MPTPHSPHRGGMNGGMNDGMNGGINGGMNSGMNGGMNGGVNGGMDGGMHSPYSNGGGIHNMPETFEPPQNYDDDAPMYNSDRPFQNQAMKSLRALAA